MEKDPRRQGILETLKNVLESKRTRYLTLAASTAVIGLIELANKHPEGMFAIWASAFFYALAEREAGRFWDGLTFSSRPIKITRSTEDVKTQADPTLQTGGRIFSISNYLRNSSERSIKNFID